MTPTRSSLGRLLERSGISLGSGQVDALWAYHRMLRDANAELNLTRIHNFENMVLKHYVDCLLVLNYVDLPSPLVDMGTGPGLPGIPLKIARPDVQMILAEPRGARVDFLNEVVAKLGLTGVEVYGGKVGRGFDRRVAGVITRAVGAIPETLDRVPACIEPGGLMIFMKGPGCDSEIEQARASHADLFATEADHDYAIPHTSHDRRLVVYRRTEVPAASARGVDPDDDAVLGRAREVSSESNPAFRHARDLLTGKGIRKHGMALVAGPRSIAEILERHRDRASAWLTDPDGAPPDDPTLDWLRLAGPLFRELDIAGTNAPLLMVRTPEMPDWSDDEPWPEGCTLFVPFQDPENVGAVIRSAAAFGAARVVLLQEAAHPFHPKSVRAAGTALFQVALLKGPSIRDLAPAKAPLFALALDGPELGSAPFPDRFGLVPGLEGPGLPDRLRAGPTLRIPIADGVESLNAAASVAVALYAHRASRL